MKYDLYLLGPMTGYPQHHHPAFHRFAKQLRRKGFTVFNPAELDEELGLNCGYTEFLARDLPYLSVCKAGAAMPGWEKSNGARWETAILSSMLQRPVLRLPSLEVIPASALPSLAVPVGVGT